MKILVAEDDDNSKQLLIDLLTSQHYEVVSFDNGIDALTYLQLNMVDLIVSDILMPELDGYGLCRAVKQNLSLKDIPFIFYTATYITSEDERFAMTLGAAAFLIKPMDVNDFLKVIKDVSSAETKKLKATRGRGLYRTTPIKVDKQHTDIVRSKLDKKIKELNEEKVKLLASEARLRDFAEASADWFWETDADLNMHIVSGGCDLMQFSHLEELATQCNSYLAQDLRAVINAHQHFSDYVAPIADPSGKQVFLRISGKAVFDENQAFIGYRGVGKDVTEMMALNRQIEFLSSHDVLTGLPNRRLLIEHLNQLIKQTQTHNEQFLLLYIDLDHFKLINDTFGHDAGDNLLSLATQRMTACVRNTDLLYRIGGDEFILVLETATPQDGHRVIRELINVFASPFHINKQRVYTTISIGASVCPDDATEPQVMINYADMAMHRAKKAGRNNFAFYRDDLNYIPDQWEDMEAGIRLALHKNTFHLAYQPQIDARTNTVVGIEALLRWDHPDHGLVPTTEFIKIAEQSALINFVDDWVIEQVCKQLSHWTKEGYIVPKVSINMSARHLRSNNLMTLLKTVPKKYRISPEMICIEITEHAFLEEAAIVKENMQAIKDAGFTISLDDFGTGHSSLLYLKRWEVDEVKIDRSFVNDLAQSTEDKAIVKAMIALAEALDLNVVAEGVESENQADILQSSGCHVMQGYHYDRPLSATDVATSFKRAEAPA